MLMPEAAVHEYNLLQAGKDKVGSPGKVSSVEPEAVAQTVGYSSYGDLRLGIGLPDTTHLIAAELCRELISHPTQGSAGTSEVETGALFRFSGTLDDCGWDVTEAVAGIISYSIRWRSVLVNLRWHKCRLG